MLLDVFENTSIQVTVCYGSVKHVSEEKRKEIMEALHNSKFGGHKGINQIYQKIRERYYWTGMRNDVQN